MKKIIFSLLCCTTATISAFAQFDNSGGSTTTTTTTTTVTDDMGGVNMNVNLGGMGGIDVNVNGTGAGGNTQQTTTVRQTTTTRNSNASYGGGYPSAPPPPPPPAYNGYTGRIGCTMPMTDSEFGPAIGSISRGSFESTKLSTAKQVLSNRCVTAQQVRAIMKTFDFEATLQSQMFS
jgi:Domain of unknown function (DUF4476)